MTGSKWGVVALVLAHAAACGETAPPQQCPAGACATDTSAGSTGLSDNPESGQTTGGPETSGSATGRQRGGSEETNDSEGTSGSETTGGDAGGIDPWLPQIDEADCAPDYAWQDAYDASEFTPRTVCPDGCDHATIGEALEVALPFDEIVVEAGTYAEGCLRIDVSPLRLRGNGGFATIRDPVCEGDAALRINGEYAYLSDIEINGFAGKAIQLHANVQQARLERLWIENAAHAISGTPPDAEVMVKDTKVKNVGYFSEAAQHQSSTLQLSPRVLVIVRSIFSHFKQRAWMLSAGGVDYMELKCNVVAKVLGEQEGEHSMHIFPTAEMVLTHNYFHEGTGEIMLYVYNPVDPATLQLTGNHFLFEVPQGDFVGILPATVAVSAVDNVVVGGLGEASLTGKTLGTVEGNTYVTDRAAAGWDPYPALPPTWPIAEL